MQKFFLHIAREHQVTYDHERIKIELFRAKFIAALMVFFEVIIITLSLLKYKENIFNAPQVYYFFLYILLLVSMLTFFLIFKKIERRKWYHRRAISILSTFYLSYILLWNVAITFLDQRSYHEITAYTIAMISTAFLATSEVWVTYISYAIAHSVFLIFLPSFQDSAQVIYGDYVNSTILLIVSFVAVYFINNYRIADFNNRMTIQDKNDELRLLYKKLEKRAHEDSLTGLYNKSRFEELYTETWEMAVKAHHFVTVIMIDVDFFKSYNDNYGHLAGDECLKQVATVLSKLNVDNTDTAPKSIAARVGGEEFAVVCSGLTEQEGFLKAEELRQQVEQLDIPHIGTTVANHLTISLGVYSSIPSVIKSKDEFIHNADVALYSAKRSIKNTVQVFHEVASDCLSESKESVNA